MAVGDIYNDGVYRYTVLTESGNTGTVSIGAFTTESVVGNVTLPDKYISGSMTYDVTAIENGYVNVPTTIGVTGSFTQCKNMTGVTIPETIISYNGPNPAGTTTYSGGWYNFNSSSLTYINLLNKHKIFPEQACFSKTNIRNIDISGITRLSAMLFNGCNYLKEIHIPNTCKAIYNNVFGGSYHLKRIYIGNGVTTCYQIGSATVNGIEEVYVDSQYVVDHFHEIFPQITSSSSPLRYVEIGDSVTSISGSAFISGSSLREIKLGKNVREIGANAFRLCDNLHYINIPDSVISINNGSFTSTRIYNLNIPENTILYGQTLWSSHPLYINYNGSSTKFPNASFNGIRQFTRCKLTINCNNVYELGDSCFNLSYNLMDLRFPASINKIGNNCFGSIYNSSNDSYLHSIIFEGNCPITSSTIFNDNYYSNLKIYYYENTEGWTSQFGNKNIPTQQVFRGYYTSGNFTYKFTDGHDNRPNVSVKVADGVKSSGAVTIPGKITIKGLDYYVRSIEEEGFKDQYKITSITFDSNAVGLLDIGKNAFKGCSKLESISNTSTLLDIFEGAFDGCSSLLSFTIPDTVLYLFKNTFRNCKNLTTCTISNSSNIYVIEENCFQNCEKLQSINIPNNVDRIQSNTFANCTSLQTVTYGTDLEDIFESAFSNCKNLASFTASSTNNLKRIRDKAFYNCYVLTIPPISAATQIGEYCFYNNRSLTSLTLPDTIDYIKDYAFGNCVNLTTLTNDTNQYADFGNNVFLNCKVSL